MFRFEKLIHYQRILSGSLHPHSTHASTATTIKCPFPHEDVPKAMETPKAPKKLHFTDEDYQKAKPYRDIPGPSILKFISNLVIPGGRYFGKDMLGISREIQKEYGDFFRFPLGMPPMYIVCDPAEIEVIFRNEGQWPERRTLEIFEIFRRKERPDLFKGMGGLIQDQGKSWQDTRTKVNPVLMHPKTIKPYILPIERIADDFLQRIEEIKDANNEMPSDFRNELNKWSLESVSYIAMNQRLGLLKETDHSSKGQQLIDNIHIILDLSFKLEIMPSVWRYFPTRGYKKLMAALNSTANIITEFIEIAMKDFERNPTPAGEQESILQKLLKIDKNVAIIMALDMLMAGVDTTSNSVIMLIYALALNPHKQNLLREEILQILPERDTKLTADSMRNMPYLRACMKESARLRSIVIGTGRRLPVNSVISGYQVPKGIDLMASQMMTSTSERFFKRSNDFLPERFLKGDESLHLKSQHPFAFLPFGFGSRMCIGKRLAELEIEVLIAKLIRNYEIKWDYPELKMKNEMINSLAGPLKFKFVPVSK